LPPPAPRPVEQPHEVIGDVAGPAVAAELQLARVRCLERFGEGLHIEVHADADVAHAAQPQVVVLAIDGARRRRLVDDQRLPVGQLPEAVAVTIAVAELVEERARRRRVVGREALEALDVALDVRWERLGRRQRVAVADDPDLGRRVVSRADRTPQRDLVGRVAADDRVLHVEVREGGRELDAPFQAHAARGVFRKQIARGIDELRRDIAPARRSCRAGPW
jgi:hypothetical protein